MIRDIDKTGITEDMFSDIITYTFTTNTSDNRVIELINNGSNIEVSFHNRHLYCDLVIQVSIFFYKIRLCLLLIIKIRKNRKDIFLIQQN